MDWIEIKHGGNIFQAFEFLDGVFVRIPDPFATPEYVPGWRIEPSRGDMDGPAFRRRPRRELQYSIALVPFLGDIQA